MVEDVDISIILRERPGKIGFRQTLRQIGELGFCDNLTGHFTVIRGQIRVINRLKQRGLAVSLFADDHGFVPSLQGKGEIFY